MVVTFHGHDVTVDPAALSRHNRVNARYVRERSRLFQACAGIITVSQYLAGRLVEQGAAPDRVRVIPCGVDTRQFSVTPVPEQGPIVFVGRLVEKKGCADLLRAVSALDNPPETVVIGDGPLGGELQRLAEDLRIRVAFKGSQSSAAVRDALRRARVVVIPSKTAANGDQEGLPVVSLEAAAAARPVVASRHSGLGESVIHGRTGLLYREGDIAALRCALDSVLGDPARAQAYGTAGGAWVRERFDLAGAVRQVEEVYDMALGAARE
jgi:glycosyltransferase involved in cell wall biosynthesis